MRNTSLNLQDIQLISSGFGWKFANESELERFLWEFLPDYLDCQPLQRQFRINNQCCDILAIGYENELIVIELKVVEDRYLVSQLTRYFDAIAQEQPFADQVNYLRPIRLIAIAPSYHPDNLTDVRYSQLSFELYQHQIEQQAQNHYLILLNLHTQEQRQQQIPVVQLPNTPAALPDPPHLMLTWLKRCTPKQRDHLLKLRIKILNFDPRIQEVVQGQSIFYGKGKKHVAELCIDPAREFCIFFWFPNDENFFRGRVRRFRYWTNWITASYWGACHAGFQLDLRRRVTYKEVKQPFNQRSLENLLEKALKIWKRRMEWRQNNSDS
ncbi:hypothetical protein VZG28_02850 [Synechococcus elongatus IITB4]|uniref:hypothetical protein n=1 Tax=Synechococcus elongatus TaxID=32046 RepID=UPI0030D1F611